MTYAQGLIEARSRVLVSMLSRATIRRKGADGWDTVATDVRCMVERQLAGGSLRGEAVGQSPDTIVGFKVSLPYGTDLRTGDQLTITGGQGAGTFPVMIAGDEIAESLAVMTQFIATAESSAVESYSVRIERWDDEAEAYVETGPYAAQAVYSGSTAQGRTQDGAAAGDRKGTLIVDESVGVRVGDWILGLPFASAAEVVEVLPAVAGRQDARITIPSGNVR